MAGWPATGCQGAGESDRYVLLSAEALAESDNELMLVPELTTGSDRGAELAVNLPGSDLVGVALAPVQLHNRSCSAC